MKKIFIIALIVIVLVIVVLKVESVNTKPSNFTINDITNDLLETVAFEDKMESIDNNMIPIIYDIEENYFVDSIAYAGSGATAEELCVFKTENSEQQLKIYNILLERIQKKRYSYSSYMPNEVAKIDNAVLVAKNNVVVLCITNNDSEARKVIARYI